MLRAVVDAGAGASRLPLDGVRRGVPVTATALRVVATATPVPT